MASSWHLAVSAAMTHKSASGFSRDMSNGVVPVAASRHVVESVLTLAECRELVFIQRCVCVIGYRAHVRSSTIHDVAATEPALLIPLVRMPWTIGVASGTAPSLTSSY